MHTIIHGVPVAADPALSWEEINRLVSELIRDRIWEGRQLRRVELLRDGQTIHIYSYDHPSITYVPVTNKKK
jgi:hypothetical protein